MSRDVHLLCLDCGERGMDDGDNTNHWDEEMAALARNAPALAAFADVVASMRVGSLEPILKVDSTCNLTRPQIDLNWFKKHVGHRIVPEDEYGHLATECTRPISCGECGARYACRMPLNHEGPCDPAHGRKKGSYYAR